jgi:hypothetical protein
LTPLLTANSTFHVTLLVFCDSPRSPSSLLSPVILRCSISKEAQLCDSTCSLAEFLNLHWTSSWSQDFPLRWSRLCESLFLTGDQRVEGVHAHKSLIQTFYLTTVDISWSSSGVTFYRAWCLIFRSGPLAIMTWTVALLSTHLALSDHLCLTALPACSRGLALPSEKPGRHC